MSYFAFPLVLSRLFRAAIVRCYDSAQHFPQYVLVELEVIETVVKSIRVGAIAIFTSIEHSYHARRRYGDDLAMWLWISSSKNLPR
jgi:hypothetical protein